MKKKVLITLVASFMLVLAVGLAGCSGNTTPSSNATDNQTKTEAATADIEAIGSAGTTVTNPVDPLEAAAPTMSKHDGIATCENCHGEANPTSAPSSDAACFNCHTQESIIAATASYDDVANKSQNPHDSHMHGTSCFNCHSNHGDSQLACDNCHMPAFGWDVP